MSSAAAMEQLGLRKAAILLVNLGRDDSAKVLAKMREVEVEAIMAEIVKLQDVAARRGQGRPRGVPRHHAGPRRT